MTAKPKREQLAIYQRLLSDLLDGGDVAESVHYRAVSVCLGSEDDNRAGLVSR